MSRNSFWNTDITDWNNEINHKWLPQLWMSKTMHVERNKTKHCPQQDLKCEWIWWWNWWCHDIRIHGVDKWNGQKTSVHFPFWMEFMGRKSMYISLCEWSLWEENQYTFPFVNGVYGQKTNVHFPFWMEFMGRKPMYISPSEWSSWAVNQCSFPLLNGVYDALVWYGIVKTQYGNFTPTKCDKFNAKKLLSSVSTSSWKHAMDCSPDISQRLIQHSSLAHPAQSLQFEHPHWHITNMHCFPLLQPVMSDLRWNATRI